MFVPRSARRITLARVAFLLVALLPAVALVAWAVQRHSLAHRDAVRREWEAALGLPVAIASVEHPLPGVVRARGCVLSGADGRAGLATAAVRVETSPTEVRLEIGSLACDPAGAAELARLAGEWLLRGARFRRDVVIDVASLVWELPAADGHLERRPLGPLRVECVVAGDERAVRVVRRATDEAVDEAADEVRVVWSPGGAAESGDGGRLAVEGSCTEPLPVSILAALLGPKSIAGLPLGPESLARGRVTACVVDGAWDGDMQGVVERIDLAACTAGLAAGASGSMAIEVRDCRWRDGRLASCDAACTAEGGRVDRRLLEALVSIVGCRAGAAAMASLGERECGFDVFACGVRIDGRGIELAGTPRLGGALAVTAGRPLLDPPVEAVPADRFAWLLAAPGAVYVPSSGPGSWLLSVLPAAGPRAERTSRAEPEGQRSGF